MTNETKPSDEPGIADILSSFGTFARWYGYDEAMDTKGKHTSSTPADAQAKAESAINSYFVSVLEELSETSRRADDCTGDTMVVKWKFIDAAISKYKSKEKT